MPGDLTINMPIEWANFFTTLLLSPKNFLWTRDFLSSKAISLLDSKYTPLIFVITNRCPVEKKLACISEFVNKGATEKNLACISEIVDNGATNLTEGEQILEVLVEKQGSEGQTCTPPGRKRIGKRTAPPVDSEIRRSDRLKQAQNGFKPNSGGCKNCLASTPLAPTLSKEVIKNLGVQFCKMNPDDLSDEALMKKRSKPSPVKKGKGKLEKFEANDGKETSKKAS